MLWLLLKNKMRMFVNGYLKGAWKNRSRRYLSLAAGAVVFFLLFNWSHNFFSLVLDQPEIAVVVVEKTLSLIFLSFFFLLLVGGVTVSLHFVFTSSDLPLLMSAPVSVRIIFAFKFIEAVLANSGLFLFFGISILLGYGVAAKAGYLYYLTMSLTSMFFLALPAGLSVLIAMLAVRIIPAARAREISSAMTALITLTFWIGIQVFRLSYFDRSAPDFNPDRLEQLRMLSNVSFLDVLPSTWAARTLTAVITGNFQVFWRGLWSLAITSASMFVLCLILAQNLYHQGIGKTQLASPPRRKNIVVPHSKLLKVGLSLVPRLPLAIISRDLKMLVRDFRQMTQLLLFGLMMIILPFVMSQSASSEMSSLLSEDYPYPYFFVLLFTALSSSTLTARLIPLDGRAFWMLKLAPHPLRKLLWGKYTLGYLSNLVMAWIAVIILACLFDISLPLVLFALSTIAIAALGACALGVVLGAIFPKFDWEHPKRMLTTSGGLLLSLASLLWGGLFLLLIFFIWELFAKSVVIILAILITCLGVTILASVVSVSFGGARLEKWEWEF